METRRDPRLRTPSPRLIRQPHPATHPGPRRLGAILQSLVNDARIRVWHTFRDLPGLRALAALPDTVCKLSGLVTEADWNHWSPRDLAPYAHTALDAFGPGRVMFGSDRPVCTPSPPTTRR
ncbi:amidohydrolase family protein [Spongiactinospora sp. TRM90649]|uniref:amidohydrolase family protein n=1 Tax=Spongiactinospora sp. TRM90649 TaxID=3031114 RepID=UPI0023F694B1|nr:amidohydrolase family protein [Spongiactinospora sp. TRM90649]MDF5752907.1 amidohydrolase family protein [Spongiactinospora sp. TRM90649]